MAHQVTSETARFVGNLSAIPALITDVAAKVATLVADGASPTQAHVTALNTSWGSLLSQISGLSSAELAVLFVAADGSHNEVHDAIELLRHAALNSVARS